MFSCMIARTSTAEVIFGGGGGTKNGALQLVIFSGINKISGGIDVQVELIEPAVTGILNVLKACSETSGKKVVVVSSIDDVLMNANWPRDLAKDEACWLDKEYCRATKVLIPRKTAAVQRYIGNGKVGHVNQANNMYLFPGIWHIKTEVGAAVVREASVEELAEGHGNIGTKELMYMSEVRTIMKIKAVVSKYNIPLAPTSNRCFQYENISRNTEETKEYVARSMWYPGVDL
ncbi:hypothetical protein GIB67_038755 [Kingdonia uniflora]|uniref:Uncharacterized protein n=1 Tax=Kingdonia uniflora TaxID=39325 RepID=A0A7J7NTB5_9MAGN|nr:hypothetical protein GIB67_038755 [Kingdonia uniflora]